MHAKCLTTIGRTKPECLCCDEIKVKPEPRGGEGGDPPNPPDDDANTFRTHLDNAHIRHDLWTKMPTTEKLQFEQKYTYGMGQLPP
eukprot:25701-Amphidinium_carterae.1